MEPAVPAACSILQRNKTGDTKKKKKEVTTDKTKGDPKRGAEFPHGGSGPQGRLGMQGQRAGCGGTCLFAPGGVAGVQHLAPSGF